MPLSDKAKQNKQEYIKKYAKENYKRVSLLLRDNEYKELKQATKKANESLNGYIKKAIKLRMDKEKV